MYWCVGGGVVIMVLYKLVHVLLFMVVNGWCW